jgi:hypothetical protein
MWLSALATGAMGASVVAASSFVEVWLQVAVGVLVYMTMALLLGIVRWSELRPLFGSPHGSAR